MERFVFIELLNNPDVANPPARSFEAVDIHAAIALVEGWAVHPMSTVLITDRAGVPIARRDPFTEQFIL